jgi:hypothetical protein
MIKQACFVSLLMAATSCASDPETKDVVDGNADALYAVSSAIFDETGATSYITLIDSLEDRTIALKDAVELAGWSSIAAHEGKLFVGGGEAAEITRYTVSDKGELGAAERLNFADYGLSSVSFSHNAFVDEKTAHLRLNETSRIVWNHKELSIEGSEDAPEIERERDGLMVSASNFEGIAVRDDAVLWPYFWHDADWYKFDQSSQIAFYDKDGTTSDVLDVPCPALNIASPDEDGNVYFSGMVDTVGYQLKNKGALTRCVARVNKGEREIADGWPRQLEELTDGRPAGRFYYLRDGKGLLTVYHGDVELDENADPATVFMDDWGLWLIDLEAWKAEPIEDWDRGSSNLFFSRVDDKTFLHKVSSDFSETQIFEIKADGSFKQQLTVPGYSIVLVRVR